MPKTILLADDSVTIQKVVGISFANEDVVLLTVDNGDDAVTRARESRPDIVLADIVMPGKSGYEVCEALRSEPTLADIPVLLLSGTFETFDEDRAREVGANGHITKPFEAQSLVDRVNELLEAGVPPTPEPAAAQDAMMGTSFADPSASQSGSESYDFFDDEMPSMSGSEPPQLAETKLIGHDLASDSLSGQVFDLEPMEERGGTAAPIGETPAAAGAMDEAPEASQDDSDGGFGASFAPEEPVASSSAFSFDENPALAEAVEAFAHPDSHDAPARPEPDPLTTPVPMASEPGASGAGAEADSLSDEVLARGVSQNFDATEIHQPDPGPAAGDDLYDEIEGDIFADSGVGGSPFADEASAAAIPPMPPEVPAEPAAFPEAEPLPAAAPEGWDEDPESLSQSALEPLPALGSEPEADVMAESHERPPATSIPVEAPAVPEPPPAPAAVAGATPAPIPAELQERMHATLERVAWEAMGDLSERVIKETLSRIESIAWEVIPQMAETMIREALERITASDEDE